MIKGIVFDKDGTLFDFNATWGAWAKQMLVAEAGGDTALFDALADVLGFDPVTARFRPGSVVIASTVSETADAMLQVLDADKQALIARMNATGAEVEQVAATALVPYFAGLRDAGLVLGIATNDAESSARRHLEREGITAHFDFVAGYDSGHGAKPGAGQLDAFCAQTGIASAACAMVGDSLHDLHAGRAAGMLTIGVLTGPAPAEELSPHADIVLTGIADIPDWLRAQNLL